MNDDRSGGWTAVAVVAALAASACCILPLALGGLGLSVVALAGFFESARPYVLVVTALLIGAGFYYSYFRRRECAPGEECELPRPALRRSSRMLLWLGAASVLALAFFPSYASLFAGDEMPPKATLGTVASERVVLSVQGMTCEGCAAAVQRALSDVPGVLSASVRYAEGEAVVVVEAGKRPEDRALSEAVEQAGYNAAVKEEKEG